MDETDEAPASTRIAVEMNGRWFSIPPPPRGAAAATDWNLEAFQALSNLYHLTTVVSPGALMPQPVIGVGGVR